LRFEDALMDLAGLCRAQTEPLPEPFAKR